MEKLGNLSEDSGGVIVAVSAFFTDFFFSFSAKISNQNNYFLKTKKFFKSHDKIKLLSKNKAIFKKRNIKISEAVFLKVRFKLYCKAD